MKYEHILIEQDDTDLLYSKETPVTINFDRSTPPIGHCEIRRIDYKLYADFEVNDNYDNYYPAIGYTTSTDEIMGRIYEVALCTNSNVDEQIKTIGEQSKKEI